VCSWSWHSAPQSPPRRRLTPLRAAAPQLWFPHNTDLWGDHNLLEESLASGSVVRAARARAPAPQPLTALPRPVL